MTDMRDIVFLIQYTKDQTVTLESVENLSSSEYTAIISALAPAKSE